MCVCVYNLTTGLYNLFFSLGSLGMRRLNTMVSSLVLRRTKEELAERKELTLTHREINSHMITLRQEEKDIYQVIFDEAR